MRKWDFKYGDTFGCRTFLHEVEPKIYDRSIQRRGLFRCECGKEFIVELQSCFSISYKKCRCAYEEHAKIRHPLSRIWGNMKRRCYNPADTAYKDYGGRGIKMCDEWLNDFNVFFKWCIDNNWKQGLHIDRIDNDGDYEPINCRIVTVKKNANNKRTTTYVMFRGNKMAFTEALELVNLSHSKETIRHRIKHQNMSFEAAVNIPAYGHFIINGESKNLKEWANLYNIPIHAVYRRLGLGWGILNALTKSRYARHNPRKKETKPRRAKRKKIII